MHYCNISLEKNINEILQYFNKNNDIALIMHQRALTQGSVSYPLGNIQFEDFSYQWQSSGEHFSHDRSNRKCSWHDNSYTRDILYRERAKIINCSNTRSNTGQFFYSDIPQSTISQNSTNSKKLRNYLKSCCKARSEKSTTTLVEFRLSCEKDLKNQPVFSVNSSYIFKAYFLQYMAVYRR